MSYLGNETWQEFYKELDPVKRQNLYKKISRASGDDGANKIRKELLDWRYTDPKKPDKNVDKGIWEMVLMPAHVRGFLAFSGNCKKQIFESLGKLQINEETMADEVLKSAVYWEVRNIARRFYDTCNSPKYGRKFFGMTESSWDEKLDRMSRDLWTMAEFVPQKFKLENEMKVFSDAVLDEFFEVSPQAKTIYFERKYKLVGKKLPIVL